MISTSEFIGIRLTDIRGDGSSRAATDIDAVMRRQNAIGMLASGNTIDQIEKVIVVSYRDTLSSGASFIADADPDDPQSHAGALDEFARSFERDVLRQYANDFGRLGWVGMTYEQRQGDIASQLATVRDRVVGDFKFGLAGGRRMTTSKPSVQNTVHIHGPVGGSAIIAPGATFNQPVVHSDEGVRELADRMLSELRAATAGEADARRLAEEAKAELAKPKPDRSVIVKLLARAGSALATIGNDALSAVAKEAAKGYAREFGIIPPVDD